MINPKSGPAATAKPIAQYLHKQLIHARSLQQAGDPLLAELAAKVADGDISFSEAGDVLLRKAMAAGVTLDTDIDGLRYRIDTDLANAADRLQNPDVELPAPAPVLRADTDPKLAALLQVEPGADLSLVELTHLMQARQATGDRIPGKRYIGSDAQHQQQMGYLDVVFSPGKDVSVAWAFATPVEKQLIFQAHLDTVDVVMKQVEVSVGHVRRGDTDREPAHITWIALTHATARPASHPSDPQLHSHVIIPNVTLSKINHRVGSLDTYGLHNKVQALRKQYNHALSIKLQRAGIGARYDQVNKAVRIDAIPERVSRQFSKRTEQARVAAIDYTARRGVEWAGLTSEEQSRHMTKAAAATRRSMDSSAPDPVSWQAQVRDINWQPTTTLSQAGRTHQTALAVHRQARAVTAQATARIQAMTPAQHSRRHELQQVHQLEETLRFHRGQGLRPVDDLTRKI